MNGTNATPTMAGELFPATSSPPPTTMTTKRGKNKKNDEEKPSGPPVMPELDATWCTRTCLQMFDAWRGAPLLDLGQIKYANSCAKRLAENYSREQVCQVREAMNKQDFWMDQGGADVCDVARHMQKELNKLRAGPRLKVVEKPPEVIIRNRRSFTGIASRQGAKT